MTPQIQITLNCNLSCTYCYESHDGMKRMDDATLKNVIDKCIAYSKKEDPSNDEITFYWHGGEPLLCGRQFFEKILEFESFYPDITFKNNVQTNGVAMTKAMADFMVAKGFNLGFSMDGPEAIQNRHRLFRGGAGGSFDAVIKGIRNYKERAGVPFAAIIAVVSKYTVQNGAEPFYQFFRDLGACLQFQPYDITWRDLQEDALAVKKREFMPGMEEYAQFVIDLFDLWFHDDPEEIILRDLKTEIKMLLAPMGGRRNIVDKKRCASDRTIIDPYGNVYSCDMYVNNEETALGNINRDPLERIMDRKYALWEQIKRCFRKGKSGFKCLSCEYGNTCIGGCLTCMKYNYHVLKGYSLDNPRQVDETNRYFESHFSQCGDSYYCEAFRIYRRHIQQQVNKELLST